MAFEVPDGVRNLNPHVDLSVFAGPYNSVEEANNAIPTPVRMKGLRCIIYIDIYSAGFTRPVVHWYYEGVADSDLVPMPYFANEQNISYLLSAIGSDGIVSGGVDWISDLTFQVSEIWFKLNSQVRQALPVQITLSPGDDTYDRIDSIVVNGNGTVSVLEGTPSPTPFKPIIQDFIFLEITSITVPSGATSLDENVEESKVYYENLQEVGDEWETGFYQTSNIDFNNTESTYQGTKSIKVNLPSSSSNFQIQSATGVTIANTDTFSFYIKLVSISASSSYSITIKAVDELGNNSNTITDYYNNFNLDYSSSDWQLVTIPISLFSGLLGSSIVKLIFTTATSLIAYIDNIRFIGGVAEPVQPTQVSWENVSNKPNFANVATSGDYNDLSNTPALGNASDANFLIESETQTTSAPSVEDNKIVSRWSWFKLFLFQVATSAITITGTSTTRWVSPAGLTAWWNNIINQAITFGNNISVTSIFKVLSLTGTDERVATVATDGTLNASYPLKIRYVEDLSDSMESAAIISAINNADFSLNNYVSITPSTYTMTRGMVYVSQRSGFAPAKYYVAVADNVVMRIVADYYQVSTMNITITDGNTSVVVSDLIGYAVSGVIKINSSGNSVLILVGAVTGDNQINFDSVTGTFTINTAPSGENFNYQVQYNKIY